MEPRSHQEALQKQLEDARVAYVRATAEYKRLMTLSAQTAHPDDPGFVDGMHALRQGLRIHQQARVRYEEALRHLSEFALSKD